MMEKDKAKSPAIIESNVKSYVHFLPFKPLTMLSQSDKNRHLKEINFSLTDKNKKEETLFKQLQKLLE